MADGLTFTWSADALAEIDAAMDRIKYGTQRVAAEAALAPAQAELEAAKTAAPVKTGTLRESLVLHMERNRADGKQVFDVMPTAKANSLLQKKVKNPGIMPGGKKRRDTAYYPASMEYGFMTVNGKHVPGHHYLAGSLAAGSDSYRESMLEAIEKNIDEAWGD